MGLTLLEIVLPGILVIYAEITNIQESKFYRVENHTAGGEEEDGPLPHVSI